MLMAARKLSLGIALILLCSGALLGWDYIDQRAGRRVPRVAILQQNSTQVLDDCVLGMIEGLAARGYRNGETMELRHYNAEGDLSMANAIARQITDGTYKLVLTSSTTSLQVVAAANASGRTMHVFGAVADPYVAGVGLEREKPLQHPRHLVGLGSFLPVDDAFHLARTLYPGLKKIGVAHNPAEANSRAFMEKARAVCKDLDIELIDAPVDNSSSVKDAVDSVAGRGAEAIWVGGDVTVSSVLASVINSARHARIPVFSMLPGKRADQGTLFDLGVDFELVGKMTGELAGGILNGDDPATIPIRDVIDLVPKKLTINLTVLKGLKDPWQVPESIRHNADFLVDETGTHEKQPGK